MHKYYKLIIVAVFMMIFATWLSHNVKSDLPLIFQKDLHAHDESSNSVVAANLTRKVFPPTIRVNPLNETQGNWMEGPFWQHIPPLFAYVPYGFFLIDGQVTIEVKRLAYAFLILLTGFLFIWIAYRFSKNLAVTFAALVASIFWINTPFTHELITGYTFGVSDIVLAFCSVLAFGGLLYYFSEEKPKRLEYSWKRLALIAFLVALPIMAKNLLGAIPAAVFIVLLFWDQRRFNIKFWTGLIWFVGFLTAYYLPLYIASPVTFKNEILVAFLHGANYEGWGRPWHFYLTNYLPQRYLFGWTWVYFLGLVLGIGFQITDLRFKFLNPKVKILLWLSLGWFLFNVIVVSLISSKIANFIYQSYLLSLFGIALPLAILFDKAKFERINPKILKAGLSIVLLISILVTGRSYYRFANLFQTYRSHAYSYNSEHEKFYEVGEWMQDYEVTSNDITFVRVSDNDCWLRYYILFLTGAESKTLLEARFFADSYGGNIKAKYNRLLFVVNKSETAPQSPVAYQRIELPVYSVIVFDLKNLDANQIHDLVSAFVTMHQKDIDQDIERIKADKTSCQWLVPDEILNAK